MTFMRTFPKKGVALLGRGALGTPTMEVEFGRRKSIHIIIK